MEKTTGTQKKALGRGLASLLPKTDSLSSQEKHKRIPGITVVEIDAIRANTFQPRQNFSQDSLKDLSLSIQANGIIQPLIVRREPGKSQLQLIAGERRLKAAKLAGLKQVPVVVRQSSDRESLEIALVENVQRENLNCIEIALSYFQLMEDFQFTQEQVAKRVGKDRSSIANHVRLLKLPEEIIEDLRTGKLSFGHGKALLALGDHMQKIGVRNRIFKENLSVRDTEQLVADFLSNKKGERRQKYLKKDEAMQSLSDRIGRVLGSKVILKGKPDKGTIVIKYFSRKDLDRLSERLLK